MQPIIRGIQAVGAVDIWYKYGGGSLTLPSVMTVDGKAMTIDTSAGIKLAGFRLDGEFLRAVQQIASSVVIPILGGGGVALTNNNRTGTLTINCAKVSTPDPDGSGKMYTPTTNPSGIGVVDNDTVYDMVFIAQAQQAQSGGDSLGAKILVSFQFCGRTTRIQFEGCTIATVDPIGMSGNDAANYSVAINYLNWKCDYSGSNASAGFID